MVVVVGGGVKYLWCNNFMVVKLYDVHVVITLYSAS